MAQKLISLEEAANQLGISKERLLQLREDGKVAGYRDGTSWKFRSEAIEKIASEGLSSWDAGASDLSLLDEEDEPAPGTKPPSELDLQPEGSKVDPGSSDLSLEHEEMTPGPASDLSLDDVEEPTVEGDDADDDVLALEDEPIDLAKDSILLSEAELGATPGRPPSTIIGKGDLDLDADLDLSPIDSGTHGPVSDVKLASESDILPAADDDLALDVPGSGNFEGLEELEVDLEAESSRILSPTDVVKAQAAAAAASKASGLSDLELAPASDLSISTSDIDLGGDSASGAGLTGLSALELDDEDDQVLGEGSDVTLSGESSGINIISPSDSGLALDEVPLDLSGSAPMGSSLDLGESVVEDVSLDSMASGISGISGIGQSKIGEDFQLTPLGEEGADEEKDSSQVIALDELSEETAGSPLGPTVGEGDMTAEDFAMGLTPGAAPVTVVAGAETPFSTANVLSLSLCLVLLGLCGMVTFDLLRNMWSWDGISSPSSTLLDTLNPFL